MVFDGKSRSCCVITTRKACDGGGRAGWAGYTRWIIRARVLLIGEGCWSNSLWLLLEKLRSVEVWKRKKFPSARNHKEQVNKIFNHVEMHWRCVTQAEILHCTEGAIARKIGLIQFHNKKGRLFNAIVWIVLSLFLVALRRRARTLSSWTRRR